MVTNSITNLLFPQFSGQFFAFCLNVTYRLWFVLTLIFLSHHFLHFGLSKFSTSWVMVKNTRCSLDIVFFSNSGSIRVCTGLNRRRPNWQSFKKLQHFKEKNTIFKEHPIYFTELGTYCFTCIKHGGDDAQGWIQEWILGGAIFLFINRIRVNIPNIRYSGGTVKKIE